MIDRQSGTHNLDDTGWPPDIYSSPEAFERWMTELKAKVEKLKKQSTSKTIRRTTSIRRL